MEGCRCGFSERLYFVDEVELNSRQIRNRDQSVKNTPTVVKASTRRDIRIVNCISVWNYLFFKNATFKLSSVDKIEKEFPHLKLKKKGMPTYPIVRNVVDKYDKKNAFTL